VLRIILMVEIHLQFMPLVGLILKDTQNSVIFPKPILFDDFSTSESSFLGNLNLFYPNPLNRRL